MAEHEWKIGDWCEYEHSTGETARYLVYKVTLTHNEGVFGVWGIGEREKTISPHSNNKSLKHLPDCDSWTWQLTPKLQLREGAWYERADGKVVGPCKRLDGEADWYIDQWFYNNDGTHWGGNRRKDITREVPAPTPKYRPFANAAEFKPHRDRWIVDKNNWAVRVTSLSDKGANGSSWESLVKHWTFEDTGLPCGVEVQS